MTEKQRILIVTESFGVRAQKVLTKLAMGMTKGQTESVIVGARAFTVEHRGNTLEIHMVWR